MFSLSLPLDPILRASVLIGIGLFFFLWIFMFSWAIHDAMERSPSTLFHCLAGMSVLLFHVVGLCLYLLFRPRRTLYERYMAESQHEALLANEDPSCSNCGFTLPSDFIFCPECGKKARKTCPACNKPMEMTWKRCPHCGMKYKKQVKTTEHTRS